MLKQGLIYAKEIFGAKKVSLGVFKNNEPAYYCYKAAGFKDI
ncbi:MAG: GNAT family N-acetyltransferase, partial [Lachnospiraceae bacterium]|nr:GNAT family N-acetyltransferase [Lachnospiraceae bacterium]